MTKFISTGSTLLDLALGGGLALGATSAIYGKQATGKSLIAGELAANFFHTYPNGKVFYLDCEAAFNPDYAERINLPVDQIEFIDEKTVEGFFTAVITALNELPDGEPGLFILDSLDDLSTEAEIARDIKEGTYGDKAKKLGEVFRRINHLLKNKDMALFIIGQIRDTMNAMPGAPKTAMGGGHSVKFHSSQTISLTQMGQKVQEIEFSKDDFVDEDTTSDTEEPDSPKNKVQKKMKAAKKTKGSTFVEKRTTEIEVVAKVEKNRFAPPYTTAAFTIRFDYGIDDLASCLQYLADRGKLVHLKCADGLVQVNAIVKKIEALPADKNKAAKEEVKALTKKTWDAITEKFSAQTTRPSKY